VWEQLDLFAEPAPTPKDAAPAPAVAPVAPLYLPHAERLPCPAEVAEEARGLGYDGTEALACQAFKEAAVAVGWERLVTEPRPYPAPESSLFKPGTVAPERWTCPKKAARLANLVLRCVASDRPRLTEARWVHAIAILPAFHACAAPDGERECWRGPETGGLMPDPCAAVAAAFPGDMEDR